MAASTARSRLTNMKESRGAQIGAARRESAIANESAVENLSDDGDGEQTSASGIFLAPKLLEASMAGIDASRKAAELGGHGALNHIVAHKAAMAAANVMKAANGAKPADIALAAAAAAGVSVSDNPNNPHRMYLELRGAPAAGMAAFDAHVLLG